MTEDAELLRHYADEQSEAAFAALVQRRIGLVYSVALRQVGGDAHLAEDVTQKVFTDLARKAAQLCQRPVLSGWLCRSAQFAASDVVRAERRRRAREKETEFMHELSPEPAAVDWEKLRPMLDEALSELADDDRDALALRFFEERSFADIGVVIRLTEDAARKRVNRALDRLHAQLARRGVTSTSAALAVVLANQAGVAAPSGLAASVTGAALAAGTGTATALGFIQLVTTTQFAAGAAAVFAFLALGTAGYKLRARQAAEAALTTANQNYAALAPRLRDVQQRAHAAEQRTAELKLAVDAAQAQAAADAAAKAWNPVAEGKAFVQRHPELVPVMVDEFNASIDLRFARLYKSRGLTSAQIEEFRSLQARATNYSWDTSVDGKSFEMSPDHFGTTPRSEANSRMRAFLGPEGWAEYFAYGSYPGHAQAVNATIEVSKDLCLTEAPLTPAQAEKLVDLFLAAFPGSGSPRGTAASKVNWSAIDAGARQILSDAQLSASETAFRRTRARISRAGINYPPPAK